MYSATQVAEMINGWKQAGISKAELTVKIAEACMGWPYVWGALGEECTVAKREYYMNRSAIGEGDRNLIKKRCQVLNGSKSSCDGCTYYPRSQRTRIFDCRGFTRWVLQQAGCGTIQGAGATSQYNTNSNWSAKGNIADMPRNQVCCVFKQVNGKTMEHTGLYCGNGKIIHCSVAVKESTPEDKSWNWTHYAIPVGISGIAPDPGTNLPTIRRGSSGEYVTLAQTKLIQRGYDLSPYGADGKFGAKTEEAVKAFQGDNGLSVDGIVGKNTWNALQSGKTTLYTVTISHVSKSVADEIVNKFGGVMKAE